MFDILVYLFENYFDAGNYPDEETLSLKLSAAGFEFEEISRALDWLAGLETGGPSRYLEPLLTSHSLRLYSEREADIIDLESRGFLTFLEGSGRLNPVQREMVIDRLLAVHDKEITLEEVKLTVLMVLWRLKQPLDTLIVEELLTDSSPQQLH